MSRVTVKRRKPVQNRAEAENNVFGGGKGTVGKKEPLGPGGTMPAIVIVSCETVTERLRSQLRGPP